MVETLVLNINGTLPLKGHNLTLTEERKIIYHAKRNIHTPNRFSSGHRDTEKMFIYNKSYLPKTCPIITLYKRLILMHLVYQLYSDFFF